jgi:D-glycero-D-manno-heptose 1,7-bisphosphate phosphatase
VAKLVILDRDGVINHDSAAFIRSPDDWQPIDGSLEGIAMLTAAGFEVAVATNQSGIGRGLLDETTLAAIHDKMRRQVSAAGGEIGAVVYCPHHPDEGCECRKPLPGLLQRLSQHYDQPVDGVPVIGDSLRDIDAAVAAGARPILVLTGNGRRTQAEIAARGDTAEAYPDLLSAASALVAESQVA